MVGGGEREGAAAASHERGVSGGAARTPQRGYAPMKRVIVLVHGEPGVSAWGNQGDLARRGPEGAWGTGLSIQ